MGTNKNNGVKKTRSPGVNRRVAQPAFLAAYAECGNITRAAQAAGISRSTHHLWLKEDKRYREAFMLAEEALVELVEDKVMQRVLEGEEKPVFYKGVQCGTIRCFSDRLMIMLLRALKPEKYGNRVGNNEPPKSPGITVSGYLNPEVYGPDCNNGGFYRTYTR